MNNFWCMIWMAGIFGSDKVQRDLGGGVAALGPIGSPSIEQEPWRVSRC